MEHPAAARARQLRAARRVRILLVLQHPPRPDLRPPALCLRVLSGHARAPTEALPRPLQYRHGAISSSGNALKTCGRLVGVAACR